MKNIKPVGKTVLLKRTFGGRKTTEAGIIYDDKVTNKMVWSEVVDVGPHLTEDIRVGDLVLWDISKMKGSHNSLDIADQDSIYLVDRP